MIKKVFETVYDNWAAPMEYVRQDYADRTEGYTDGDQTRYDRDNRYGPFGKTWAFVRNLKYRFVRAAFFEWTLYKDGETPVDGLWDTGSLFYRPLKAKVQNNFEKEILKSLALFIPTTLLALLFSVAYVQQMLIIRAFTLTLAIAKLAANVLLLIPAIVYEAFVKHTSIQDALYRPIERVINFLNPAG